jgi:uncharacterized protein (TIGR03083 family)
MHVPVAGGRTECYTLRMAPVGEAYAGVRRRLSELVRPLRPDEASTVVPACPEWTVHDVIAHLTGVVDDALSGRLDGVATTPWTAAQVEVRRQRSVAEILAEWEATAPTFESVLDVVGPRGRQAVLDAATHEQDVRGALGAPGARDADAVAIGLSFVAPVFLSAAADRGTPVRIDVSGGESFGSPVDGAIIVLRGEPWELMRAMTGRRSVAQLRRLNWERFDERILAAFEFGPFRPAALSLDE